MKLASSIKYYCEERSLRILVYKDNIMKGYRHYKRYQKKKCTWIYLYREINKRTERTTPANNLNGIKSYLEILIKKGKKMLEISVYKEAKRAKQNTNNHIIHTIYM